MSELLGAIRRGVEFRRLGQASGELDRACRLENKVGTHP
jgi:hypothetical protein